ncbi:hypothetical protein FRACYDRAFT_248579 [Fragilariopsis cylindrus CCMP1102]|uniref:Uncharacterized protein n=1 Tax=Fragilariopsis cylindrus CCMP1102 TaxID=635003 RepID=A0A1E7ETX2_9STRA|nr:hypothetical protein FRACYDRAFT_248579 [Fragilariopsis cylindrus CCMP1102]|eukprot:OEU09244.1 hypothetical protein FRACYDRAFT_248579 [Fragilariopsis cylindrus CCMP1102]
MKTSFSVNVTGSINVSIEPSNEDGGGAAVDIVLVDVLLKSLIDAIKKYAGDKGTPTIEEEEEEDLSSPLPQHDTIPDIVVKELLMLGLDVRYLDFKFGRESRSHPQDMALSDKYHQRMKHTQDTNNFCDYMKSKKSEAKEMDKLSHCAGCDDLLNIRSLRGIV